MAFYRASIGGGGGGQTASGSFTMSTTAQQIVTGFEPKYIAVRASNATRGYIYDADISTSNFLTVATGSSAGVNNLNTSSVNLVSVDNDGFTTKCNNGYAGIYYYFAMG